MTKVLVFAGSTRAGSYHRKLAREAAEALEKRGLAVTLADLADFPMPLYDGDLEAAEGAPVNARRFKKLAREHDAWVLASPEYNGSFPAPMKNVIDWISRPEAGEGPGVTFGGKTAALLSTSPGPGGGGRGLRHLRELLEMVGVRVIPEQVTIPRATQAFDAAGRLVRVEDRQAVESLATKLSQAMEGAKAAA